MGSISGQETKIPHGAATETSGHNQRVCALQWKILHYSRKISHAITNTQWHQINKMIIDVLGYQKRAILFISKFLMSYTVTYIYNFKINCKNISAHYSPSFQPKLKKSHISPQIILSKWENYVFKSSEPNKEMFRALVSLSPAQLKNKVTF